MFNQTWLTSYPPACANFNPKRSSESGQFAAVCYSGAGIKKLNEKNYELGAAVHYLASARERGDPVLVLEWNGVGGAMSHFTGYCDPPSRPTLPTWLKVCRRVSCIVARHMQHEVYKARSPTCTPYHYPQCFNRAFILGHHIFEAIDWYALHCYNLT